MKKLQVIVVDEANAVMGMAHCGRFSEQLCGIKACSFNGTARDD